MEMLTMTQESEHFKQALDAASVVTAIGAFMDILPAVAAIFTIVWTGLRIWETDTVKGWTNRLDK
jgi:hypothetical protein